MANIAIKYRIYPAKEQAVLIAKTFGCCRKVYNLMLADKLSSRGKYLIRVDKWYPSSQICNCCGSRNPLLKDLKIRQWDCPACGTHHDRDINAAKNILMEGLRKINAAA